MIWRLRFVAQIGGGLRCETKKRGGLRYARSTPYNRPRCFASKETELESYG